MMNKREIYVGIQVYLFFVVASFLLNRGRL